MGELLPFFRRESPRTPTLTSTWQLESLELYDDLARTFTRAGRRAGRVKWSERRGRWLMQGLDMDLGTDGEWVTEQEVRPGKVESALASLAKKGGVIGIIMGDQVTAIVLDEFLP